MTEITLEVVLKQATVSVPAAGAVFFGLGRNASYEAARRGLIPTIDIGRKKLVPVAIMAERVGLRSLVERGEKGRP